jgi:hypothetical protein
MRRSGAAVLTRATPRRVGSAVADRSVLAVVFPVWAVWLAVIAGAVLVLTTTGLVDPAHRPAGGRFWPLWSWDWGWYSGLAQHGYPPRPGPTYAFFPLWPLVLHASGPLPEWVVGGVVAAAASLLAFAGVAAAGADFVSPRKTALAMACFPGSIWLALAYPDGLAVAAAAWACVLAGRGRPLASGVSGVIAAAARPSGFLVAIPLAVTAARRGGRFWLAPVFTVAATATVFAYFWERSGVANAFFRAQESWHHHGPTLGLAHELIAYERVDRLTTAATALVAATLLLLAYRRRRHRAAFLTAAYAICVTYVVLAAPTQLLRAERTLAAVVLPLVVLLWLKGPRYRVWATYASAVVGVSLLSGSLQGFGRQALLAFPIFWLVADGPPALRSRPAAALAIAANLVLLWTLKTFPP